MAGETQLVIILDPEALGRAINQPMAEGHEENFTLTSEATRVRKGKTVKLVICGAASAPTDDDGKLIALLTEAQEARDAVMAAPTITIKELARQRNQCRHRLAKLVRLSWLSPRIVTMIVKGSHPASLTPMTLLNSELPPNWVEQERMLLGV